MKTINSAKYTVVILCFMCTVNVSSQNTNYNGGTMFANIDGDTLTWALITQQTPEYFYFMTAYGPADKGVIKIMWEKISSPSEIKTETNKIKGYTAENSPNISIQWTDIANMPYVIKEGKLTVTENSAGLLKGTVEMKVELAGSSVINEFIKGKKESVLTQGYFEIKY